MSDQYERLMKAVGHALGMTTKWARQYEGAEFASPEFHEAFQGMDDVREQVMAAVEREARILEASAEVALAENIKANVARGEPADGHAMRFIQLDLSRAKDTLRALIQQREEG